MIRRYKNDIICKTCERTIGYNIFAYKDEIDENGNVIKNSVKIDSENKTVVLEKWEDVPGIGPMCLCCMQVPGKKDTNLFRFRREVSC